MTLQNPGPLLVLGLIQVPIIFRRLMSSARESYGHALDLREVYLAKREMLCSMIIFEGSKRHSMHVGANVGGFHSRLAALSRLHSRMHLCSWQCGTESRMRVFAMEKHLFPVLSFLCRCVRYFFRQNATILVLFSPFSFLFVLSTLRGLPSCGKAS